MFTREQSLATAINGKFRENVEQMTSTFLSSKDDPVASVRDAERCELVPALVKNAAWVTERMKRDVRMTCGSELKLEQILKRRSLERTTSRKIREQELAEGSCRRPLYPDVAA